MIKKDWHFDYLGKPWSPVPRPPESYNCGELVRYVHIDLFGIDSPIVPVPDANVMRACLGAMNPVYYGLCRKADEVPMQEFDVIFLGRLREEWDMPLPAETIVTFVEVPRGGGGGSSNPLQILFMVVISILAIVASVFTAGATLALLGATGSLIAAGMAGMAVMMLGTLLMGVLFPQNRLPQGQLDAINAKSASPTYNINASGNQARLWGVMPELFGKMRVYPDFGAKTWLQYIANEQYGYFVYAVTQGTCKYHSLQFDNTVFWRDGAFVEVSGYYIDEDSIAVEFVEPGGQVTLFPDNVVTSDEVSGQYLYAPNHEEYAGSVGPFIINPAGTETNRILIDIVFQTGLGRYNDQADLKTTEVSLLFEIQKVDDSGVAISDWATAHSHTYKDATLTPQRFTIPVNVPLGRYQIRAQRTNDSKNDARTMDRCIWQSARAMLPGATLYELSVIAIRVRATNVLSQAASTKFSCTCTRELPLYNRHTKAWSTKTPTRSWAAAVSAVCKQTWGGGLQDHEFDLDALWEIDERLQDKGWNYDAYIDGAYQIWQLIGEMCQSQCIIRRMMGTMLSFVEDEEDRAVKYVFSPRNIMRGTFKITWHTWSEQNPDDVSIEYLDAALGYSNQDVTATLPDSESRKPATLSILGITDRDHAYAVGMAYASRNRWRRVEVEFQTENLGRLASVGDVVQVVHPRFKTAISGRVESWDESTLSLTAIKDTAQEWISGFLGLVQPNGQLWGPCKVQGIEEDPDTGTARISLDSTDYAVVMVQGGGNPFEWMRNGSDGGMPTIWALQEAYDFQGRMLV
jgi:hypothetical protein